MDFEVTCWASLATMLVAVLTHGLSRDTYSVWVAAARATCAAGIAGQFLLLPAHLGVWSPGAWSPARAQQAAWSLGLVAAAALATLNLLYLREQCARANNKKRRRK